MLNIDRHNYEEYFILYLDNELNEADRLAVETFVLQHTDLKEELELLTQFRLEPEMDISHPDKTSLLKNGIGSEFSMEQVLLHLDNELDDDAAGEMDNAIEKYPHIRKTYQELQKTRLEPEHIPFPDKSILYKKSEAPARIISIRWYRAAAAILLILLAGATFLLLNNRRQDGEVPEVAKTQESSPVKNPVSPQQQNQSLLANEVVEVTKNENAVKQEEKTERSNVSLNKNETVQTNEQERTQDAPQQAPSNNLPEPVSNRNAIALNETRPSQTTDPDFSNSGVTTLSPQPSNSIVRASYPEINEGDDPDQEPAGGKKNKLRGLFRKVTRTFEKRTNIDATDNDERLLVAGLSIKLK